MITPQIRPDRNGKLVTRHVKTDATPAATPILPPPPSLSALSKKDISNDDIIRDAIYLHMDEDEADSYFGFVTRKPRVVQDALAKAFTDIADSDRFNAGIAVCSEMTEPTMCVLALDDLDFIVDMARAPHGSVNPNEGTPEAYNGVLMVMTQAYGDNFSRGALNPETIDLDTYGPFLRAATITKALGLDNSAPTTRDVSRQHEHVSQNLGTFASYYPSLIRITQASNTSAMALDSHAMLDVCEVLEEYPGSDDALVTYIKDRKRFDMDEFKAVLNSPSRSLSSGTL